MDEAKAGAPAMAPVAERLHLIDSLRALALWGVIIFNMTGMVMAFVGGELMGKASGTDLGFATFDLILVQGKARSMFALLFGVGFGILMERAAARGHGFTGFYLRRMTALLAFGLFNLAFLFWGDILILYAVLGIVLLCFRGLSDRALMRLGLVLILVPPLIAAGLEWLTGARPTGDQAMAASAAIYLHGSYGAYVAENLRYYLDHYRLDTNYALMYDVGVLGLFLLGLWVARNGVFADPERWRPLFRRTAAWTVPLGLVLSVIHATRRMGIEADGAAYALVTAAYVGIPILAFGYVSLLCLWLTRGGRGLQRVLAPMGRMALTGYLGSNAIGSFVWYGWGLGQLGKWNVAAINLFALALFVGLCLFSAAWLSVFRFGPVEWLWRSISYGRVQPLRR
jgi:uncharacterized protein